MSHFTVAVVVPKDEVVRLKEYLDEVMAPYDEQLECPPVKTYISGEDLEMMVSHYGTGDLKVLASKMEDWNNTEGGSDINGLYHLVTRNPEGYWDWFAIGGRWRGYFKLKPNMPYVVGDKHWGEGPGDAPPEGWGDIVRQGDVDWEGMLADMTEKARKDWATFTHDRLGSSAPTEEEYVAGETIIATFALVDRDGKWHKKGDMGWWGVRRNEQDQEDWNTEWFNYVGACHFEDMLVLLDAHK